MFRRICVRAACTTGRVLGARCATTLPLMNVRKPTLQAPLAPTRLSFMNRRSLATTSKPEFEDLDAVLSKYIPKDELSEVRRILYGAPVTSIEVPTAVAERAKEGDFEVKAYKFPVVKDSREPRLVRIGAIQNAAVAATTDPLEVQRDAIIARLDKLIAQAAAMGVNVLCLQEAWHMPFAFCTREKLPWTNFAEPARKGPCHDFVASRAAKYGMVIISPILERDEEHSDTLWNTAVVFGHNGNVIGTSRKNHIPRVGDFNESTYYHEAQDGHPVFDTKFGKIGINICYGRHHALNWMAYGLNGSEVVFNPSATVGALSEPMWGIEARAAAIFNSYFSVGINRVGTEHFANEFTSGDGRPAHKDFGHFYGSSYVAGPDAARTPSLSRVKDGLIVSEVDLNRCRQIKDTWVLQMTMRPKLYADFLGRYVKPDFVRQIIRDPCLDGRAVDTPAPAAMPTVMPKFTAPAAAAKPAAAKAPKFRVQDLIDKKCRGEELTRDDIEKVVMGAVNGTVTDYQLAAWIMACALIGLNEQEAFLLTDVMAHSGSMLDLSALADTVDKHSTGGVGDKTTLVLAPLLAACGATTAKMSGRGLGHTGGTIDKLGSIPGFQFELPASDFIKQAKNLGIVVTGQSGDLAPADGMIYKLRDAICSTAVSNSALIAASIMSKKLCGGAQSIVLDVKAGTGAFKQNLDDARELAQMMVSIGKSAGRNMRAVLSNMSTPLGNAIGNSLEVQEAMATLKGEGPADLRELCVTLSSLVLDVAGMPAEKDMIAGMLDNGKAYGKFEEWIAAQGGDISMLDKLDVSPNTKSFDAPRDGHVSNLDALSLAKAALELGGGRKRKEDDIDMGVGIVLKAKIGSQVKHGDSLCTIYHRDGFGMEAAMPLIESAFEFSSKPQKPAPLFLEILPK